MHRQAADFGQSFRIHLKGAAADQLSTGVGHEKRRRAREISLH
jgi:hypothetical protein